MNSPEGIRLKFMLKKGLITLVICVTVLTVSCVKVDNNLGGNLVPDNDKMTFTSKMLTGFDTYTNTIDSVITSNWGETLLGNTSSPYWGKSDFSFVSTYLPYGGLNSDSLWGDNPTIDSVRFVLTSASTNGEDGSTRTIIINKLTKSLPYFRDSVYYSNFDLTDYIDNTPLAIMKLGDSTVNRFTLPISFATPLLDTMGGIFKNDTLFMQKHFGLMLKSEKTHTMGVYDRIDMSGTGVEVYYHNKNKPTADTLMALFSMSNVDSQNTSFTLIERDLSSADPVIGVDVNKLNTETSQDITYVQGQAGMLTKINLNKGYFDEIKADAKSKGFSTIVISNATLMTPMYNPTPDLMTKAVQRLGTYSDFVKSSLVADYYNTYMSETQTEEGTELTYNGRLNRAKKQYEMDITAHIQTIFIKEIEDEDTSDEEDEDEINPYIIELANEIGMEYLPNGTTLNTKEMQLQLKYIMLK